MAPIGHHEVVMPAPVPVPAPVLLPAPSALPADAFYSDATEVLAIADGPGPSDSNMPRAMWDTLFTIGTPVVLLLAGLVIWLVRRKK